MNLTTLRERLIRRLGVNYVAYMGQKSITQEWLEGYFQAKKDTEYFLDQQQVYEPYDYQTK